MPYKCCVPGCCTTGSQMFHSFPKEKVRCQRWIHNTKCFNLNYETAYKTHHKVCKVHFRPEDYTSTMRKFLHHNVVPSLHLPDFDVAKKYLCLKNVRSFSRIEGKEHKYSALHFSLPVAIYFKTMPFQVSSILPRQEEMKNNKKT